MGIKQWVYLGILGVLALCMTGAVQTSGGSGATCKEADGAPSFACTVLEFSNGTLTQSGATAQISNASGTFTTVGDNVYLTDTDNELVVGATASVGGATFSVVLSADQIGQVIKMNAAQTNDAWQVQNSAGTVLAKVDDEGSGFFGDTSASPSGAGIGLGLPNATSAAWRNNADTGNCEVEFDASDEWVMTGSGCVVRKSIAWLPGGVAADGTQCADAAAVTIGSWGKQDSIICADNDASTMTLTVPAMPDGWDAGTVTLEALYIQDAADTSALNMDVAGRCVGEGETPAAYGTEVAMDDAAVVGSDARDSVTSAAVTLAGSCAAGDTVQLQVQLDATGTTTAVATLNFVGFKMEYGWQPSD